MFINLNKINESGILIDQSIEFNEDIYISSLIKGLKDVYVKGKIYYSTTKEVLFEGNVKGKMLILDSNTCDIVDYPFECEINEILQEDSNFSENLRVNEENSLDLKELLWQNIVLEVPIRYTKSDADNLKGDHWKVINESEEKEIDPRLEKLNELFKGGE